MKVGGDRSGIKEHLRALQKIATRNGGTRYTGSQGHVQSADYVISQLPSSYWNVYTDPFTAIVFQDLADATLSYNPASPDEPFALGEDFATFQADPRRWGGTVADDLSGQYDPCYHLPCDTYPDNMYDHVLSIMSDAVAHSILTFAQSGTSVNGTDTTAMKQSEFKGNHRVK